MTRPCHELDLELSLRATGALEPGESARVEAHLAGCPACRAEAAQVEELLGLARLPPPSAQERRLLLDLPRHAVAAARAGQEKVLRLPRGVRTGRRIATGVVVAAALIALAVAPALVRRRSPPSAPPAAAAAESWQEPDLDRLWQATDVLSLESTAASGAADEAVLAALDAGAGG